MTTQIPDVDTAALDRELHSLLTSRARATAAASDTRLTADRLRSLADSIDQTSDPLAVVLDSAVSLHTPSTWHGTAATAARDRLDRHEERCLRALRSARGLAAELRAEAGTQDARAAAAEAHAGDPLHRIADIEFELGHFDHI